MNKIAEERGERQVGMAITVPPRVKGSPAYLRKKYEDTMGMVSELGNPDLFITFTGNRKWPEIEVRLYLKTFFCSHDYPWRNILVSVIGGLVKHGRTLRMWQCECSSANSRS